MTAPARTGPWLCHCPPPACTVLHPRATRIRARRPRKRPSSVAGVDVLLVLVVLAVVVLVVSAPLRRGRAEAADAAETAQRDALEAAKEAKYAEIRDAELDYRTGKLSEADWRAPGPAPRAAGGGVPARPPPPP